MKCKHLSFILLFSLLFFSSCKDGKKPIGQKEMVRQPEDLRLTVPQIIEASLEEAEERDGTVSDIKLKEWQLVRQLYENNDYLPFWTSEGKWLAAGDSLYRFITRAKNYGLFPEDYFEAELTVLRGKTVRDTSRENKLDASLWAETDLLFTSAFAGMVTDLKRGRLLADSLRTVDVRFCRQQLDSFRLRSAADFAAALEPSHLGYRQLKAALQKFLVQADLRRYTKVNPNDTVPFKTLLKRRLAEDSVLVDDPSDSLQLAAAVKRWQVKCGLKADGRISSSFLERLNETDWERFVRIAITLDRYKTLPSLPAHYIWVNIPSYYLSVIENDTVVLESRVVVGKPETPTPVLTSAVSDMITYPLWHIPNSIVVKDILPALKRDRGYLARKGYRLVDAKRKEVDPYQINWSKYSKGIPYTVIQGSGDDNALGVVKFNFPNKHSVYLHDTNQREFFNRSKRALSHGCVRVESWEDLAYYLLTKDSVTASAVPIDSLQTWLALKQKHVVPLYKRVPLYIRYFTCEGKDGELLMHEDIYGEDRRLRQTYFTNK